MNFQIITTVLFLIGFVAIIVLTEYLHKRFSLNPEHTRKIAHVMASLSSLVFVYAFDSYWYVFIIGFIFFVTLLVGKYNNAFKSIDSVKRKTSGSYLLPISICVLFYFSNTQGNNLIFVLPLLILGISDPLAATFGMMYRANTRKIIILNYTFDKTVLGSMVFFISTLFISIITLHLFGYQTREVFIISLAIAVANTLIELVSSKGIDNLSVPLMTMAILILTQ
ncbi:MAG: hypothetical protein DRJ05_14490 [Bacteroidetes bacterium]|nr:MAG: hypothetical protein DRJ05_14490 [Bacteroidota bacterium]